MGEIQDRVDKFLDSDERSRVFRYFCLLYSDYDMLSFDDRWYAEWAKLFISENLDEMDDEVEKITSAGDITDASEVVRVAYHGLLADYYYSLVEDDETITWNSISENLDDVNKRYLDRYFYCNYNSIGFSNRVELTSIVKQINEENRSKKIEE